MTVERSHLAKSNPLWPALPRVLLQGQSPSQPIAGLIIVKRCHASAGAPGHSATSASTRLEPLMGWRGLVILRVLLTVYLGCGLRAPCQRKNGFHGHTDSCDRAMPLYTHVARRMRLHHSHWASIKKATEHTVKDGPRVSWHASEVSRVRTCQEPLRSCRNIRVYTWNPHSSAPGPTRSFNRAVSWRYVI